MKKLVLAPAVALAITGLGTAPVVAAPVPADSAPAQPASTVSLDRAAATAQAEESKEESFSITPSKISLTDYSNPEGGVVYSGSGLNPGDVYHIVDTPTSGQNTGVYNTDVTVEADGTFAISINSDGSTNELFLGTYNGKIQDGDGNTVFEANYEVVDETAAVDPAIKLDTTELSADEFNANGLHYTASGLTPGGNVTIFGSEAGTSTQGFYLNMTKADANGEVSGTATLGQHKPLKPGTYQLSVEDVTTGKKTVTKFTLTGDEQAATPTVAVEDTEYTPAETQDPGVTVTGEGFTPGGTVYLRGGGAQSPFGSVEVTADENGKVSGTIKSEKPLSAGEYSVWGVDAETETSSNNVTITVAEEEAPAEASLTVSPEKIEGADFIDDKKGVTLAVENCEPGEDVHFLVNPKGQNVAAYDSTEKADENGNASVSVYGTTADASIYLGDYTVTATCGDDTLNGKFSVVPTGNAGGDDGDDSKDDEDNGNGGEDNGNGGELPRTGAELTGLVAGGALLLLGGAAVTLTLRRKKVAQGPSEF